jgi:filamentous hemagglutinin family protein
MKTQILFLTFIFSLSTSAQITTDGTLGSAHNLSGPDYQIGADLGQQHDGNLFHSFRDFNLQSWESATFSGPNHIQNVISRVTGGNPSQIDGLFCSIIPGADVYFLNPYGIMFGPNARLDVQGSFHASTADYLRLGDGGRFDARNPNDSILTVAPVESFGFLDNTPAPITIQDSLLSVSEGQTLSLIGGNLQMNGKLAPTIDSSGNVLTSSLKLATEFGQINLVSVASQGEVSQQSSGLYPSREMQGGQISVHNTYIDVSGQGGGYIFITGGHVELSNSLIYSQTKGNQNSKGISVSVDNLVLQASIISSNTNSSGKGGTIIITVADTLTAKDPIDKKEYKYSGIFSDSHGKNSGQAGRIEIQARQLQIADGAIISSETYGDGNGGNIFLVVDTISLSGAYEGIGTGISVSSTENSTGHAGKINIETHQMYLKGAAQIQSATFGSGEGGSIYIKTTELVISGQNNTRKRAGIYGASISNEKHAGKAGKIVIQADTVTLKDSGVIATGTTNASGGDINLIISNLLHLQGDSGISTSVQGGKDNGGNITIENPTFVVLNQSKIKAQADKGQGGNIRIVAEQFIKSYESLISASSRLGLDGKIDISSPDKNVTEGMLILSNETMDASRMMKTPCEQMSYQEYLNRLRFVVNPIGGSSASPFDLQPSRLSQQSTKKILTPHQKSGQKRTNPPPRQTAMVTVCRSEKFQEKTSAKSENSLMPEQLF